jgi:hypothetical protein
VAGVDHRAYYILTRDPVFYEKAILIEESIDEKNCRRVFSAIKQSVVLASTTGWEEAMLTLSGSVYALGRPSSLTENLDEVPEFLSMCPPELAWRSVPTCEIRKTAFDSSENLLVVGEGNGSFSLALCLLRGSVDNLYSTWHGNAPDMNVARSIASFGRLRSAHACSMLMACLS